MQPRIKQTLFVVTAAFGVAGCSTLDCDDPTRYVGAELHAPLKTPEGLDPVEAHDTYMVPGGGPPKDYAGGACLVKPPQLVAPPPKG